MPLASCKFSAVRLCGATLRRPTALVKKPAASLAVRCSSRPDDAEFSCGGGRLVDEGMVVLRRRIHEMKAAETNWEPPAEWAAWEEEWYGSYDADVCDLFSALQAFLASSRPGVGVGLVVLLMLAVPTSAFVLVSHLLNASRAIVSNLQQ
ncbi:uncharacterized protein LOC133895637 [Phragmites australis]|uniref:uncharacterized protein LOC133895637 n=1 Tax=Phragmites australis TaxID=29695 RepID=UPI002D795350|nr:uncharacterized protein LOC133895637 [Phragmites australis]